MKPSACALPRGQHSVTLLWRNPLCLANEANASELNGAQLSDLIIIIIIIIIYFVKRKIHKSALNRYIIQYNAITQYMSKNNNSTSKMVDEKISCDSSIKGKLLKTFYTVNDENK